MKRHLATAGAAVLLLFGCASRSFAAVETQMILDDGVGDIATITVSTGNVVGCSGTCGGLTVQNSSGDHKILTVLGTLGQFSISSTGHGRDASVRPTLQSFNQIDATSSGSGTLTVTYTDTSYTDFALNGFAMSVSGVDNVQIASSKTSFKAYADSLNGLPADAAGSLIGKFDNMTGTSYNAGSNFANPIGSSGSLESKIIMAFSGTGTLQANLDISNVPEPASIVFLGTVLLGLTTLVKKKRNA